MRRFFLAFVALIVFALSAFAQAKHPFTFEDMMKLKRVSEPEVSPDGKWVIFSVVDVDLEANTKTPHIWIAPLAGSEEKSGVSHVSPNLRDMGATERELIPDQDGDRPRWAPDGKAFAFISNKDRGSQVWIARFDSVAGTVSMVGRYTDIATEAGGELWSPDGKNILFTSDVYPECDGASDPAACNAKKEKEAEDSKVKALIFDRLLYRHWNAYKAGKRSHIFIIPIELPPLGSAGDYGPQFPRDLTPGDYDAPVFSLGGQDDYAFSPDGQEICYTSNHDKNPAASTNNDLWVVPVNVGTDTDHVGAGDSPAKVLAATRNITADNPASDSTPLYSPDGRYIAYRAQQRPGYESDQFRLMLYDRKTGEKKNLTEDFDRWVGTFAWSPDSSEIFFSAEDEGRADLFLTGVTKHTAPTYRLWGCDQPDMAGAFDDLQFSSDGKTLFATGSGITNPAEIFAVNTRAYERGKEVTCQERGNSGLVTPTSIQMEFERTHGLHFTDSIGTAGVSWKRVTHLNDQSNYPLAYYYFGSPSVIDDFWFHGAHGDPVEGFLVKPPNFDASKKYPVKFLIHGGPQGAWGDDWSYRWNPELFAAPTASTSSGYVVIMINFHGSTGYGQKFIDAINGDWGGASFEDLMKGLDYAEEHYAFIDKSRECALGASYGGYMANWILGHTDRFKCIVTHDGMFNAESAWGDTEELWFNDWEFKGTPYDNRELYRKWSPHEYAKNFKTPTLVIHGQKDYRLDVSQGFDLFTTLQMENIPSKMLYFPDEGHWVLKPQNSQLWYKTVNDWVDQWIGDQGTKK
jgi:dipeptidyl aminopeptidase/acylaminoacyl peptidase